MPLKKSTSMQEESISIWSSSDATKHEPTERQTGRLRSFVHRPTHQGKHLTSAADAADGRHEHGL